MKIHQLLRSTPSVRTIIMKIQAEIFYSLCEQPVLSKLIFWNITRPQAQAVCEIIVNLLKGCSQLNNTHKALSKHKNSCQLANPKLSWKIKVAYPWASSNVSPLQCTALQAKSYLTQKCLQRSLLSSDIMSDHFSPSAGNCEETDGTQKKCHNCCWRKITHSTEHKKTFGFDIILFPPKSIEKQVTSALWGSVPTPSLGTIKVNLWRWMHLHHTNITDLTDVNELHIGFHPYGVICLWICLKTNKYPWH